MPLSSAFLDTCRTRVEATGEYAAFVAAGALSAGTRGERVAQWGRLYATGVDGTSVASRLRAAVRAVVNAEADKAAAAGDGVVTAGERESATATLVAQAAPAAPRPPSDADEYDAYQRAVKEDILR
jgi:hypothetical protein